MYRYRPFVWLLLASALLLSPVAAARGQAQTRAGVQGGVSLDPDQFYFGGHVRTAPLADRVRFRPTLDIGIGDNVTLVALNLDFTYDFPSRQAWSLYVGGGPAVNIYHSEGRGSEAQAGFNFIVGGQHRDGLFAELKIGAMDSPSLKFGVGYTFR
jgi:hypothetical protein